MRPTHLPRRAVFYTVVGLLFVTALQSFAQTPVPTATPKALPRADNQIWNETQLLVPVSKRVELNFLQFARGGNNVSFRTDTRTGLGILIKLNKYYSIQPTYVYQYAHPGEGRKAFSHRLYVDNLIKIPVKKVNLANRIRFERIVRHGRVDLWNLRFRPGIEIPLKFGEHSMSLYANNEIFYDTFYRAWTRNRFIVGISKKINSNFTIDTFYQHQNDGFARPGNLKVFGTTFKFKLHPKQ
ncbi:MAG TPA: DUF2490 domain-containing protein [Blastocatellia bacterium]|nr:DUF2490 domain-containing protein [Blastocatellia bacterium]